MAHDEAIDCENLFLEIFAGKTCVALVILVLLMVNNENSCGTGRVARATALQLKSGQVDLNV